MHEIRFAPWWFISQSSNRVASIPSAKRMLCGLRLGRGLGSSSFLSSPNLTILYSHGNAEALVRGWGCSESQTARVPLDIGILETEIVLVEQHPFLELVVLHYELHVSRQYIRVTLLNKSFGKNCQQQLQKPK